MADAVFSGREDSGFRHTWSGVPIGGGMPAYTERSKVLAIINQCEDHLVPLHTHQIMIKKPFKAIVMVSSLEDPSS